MIKKLLLAVLLGSLIVALVWGGINRTRSTFEEAGERNGPGQESGAGNGRAATTDPASHEALEESVSSAQWVTVYASVTEIRSTGAWLRLDSGEIIRVRRAPWEYALSQGLSLQMGDRVELTGYGVGQNFEPCIVHNLAVEQKVALRDEDGRSLWGNHESE